MVVPAGELSDHRKLLSCKHFRSSSISHGNLECRKDGLAMRLHILVGMVFLTAEPAAQRGYGAIVGLTNAAPTYFQTFDTLPSSGGLAWVDDSTLAGWYAAASGRWDGTVTAAAGTTATGDIYSFGSPGSRDRALGSIASGTIGDPRYGLRILNSGSTRISDLVIEYQGEQWRNNNNVNAQMLRVDYRLGGSLFDDVGWLAAGGSLDFTSPAHNPGSAALDGNAAVNRASLFGVLQGIHLEPGTEFWLRWYDRNETGNDHALAIDDLRLTATFLPDAPPLASVPEPASLTVWGLLTLACLIWRRLKRHPTLPATTRA